MGSSLSAWTRPRVLLGFIATAIALVSAIVWWPKSHHFHFLESEGVIATRWPVDLARFQATWVQDCDQDRIPDLVVYYQDPPFWSSSVSDLLPGNWLTKVLSGIDGSEIDTLRIPELGRDLLGVLDLEGTTSGFSFVADDLGMRRMGLISRWGKFEPSADRTSMLPALTSWSNTPQGAVFCMVGLNKLSVVLIEQNGAHGGFDKESFLLHATVLPSGKGIASQVAWIEIGAPDATEAEDEVNWIRVARVPDGREDSAPLLLLDKTPGFRPDRIRWRIDQNGDGVLDWLISENAETDMRWFDGRTGRVIEESSNKWSQFALEEDGYRRPQSEHGYAAQDGFLYLHESGGTPGLLAVGMRNWTDGRQMWSMDTPFPASGWIRKLTVTEFQDLDGDGEGDFGLVVQCNSLDSSGVSTFDIAVEFRAYLVSGRSGKNVLLPR